MSASPHLRVVNQAKSAKSKWKMPFPVFTGSSQLEVITVIANCGTRTELATEAIYKWIQCKQAKGRTHFEILGKLELMENKFLQFSMLHDSFRIARRASGLPNSRILPGRVGPSSQPALQPLVEETASALEEPIQGSSADRGQEATPTPPRSSSSSERAESSQNNTGYSYSDFDHLDFESKKPPPLRLRTLLDARKAKMARRHSLSAPASINPPPPEEEERTTTLTSTRKNALLLTHMRRRSSIGSYGPSSALERNSIQAIWPAPAVAFDPPPPLSFTDSSPDTPDAESPPISRPSTSADSYYTSRTRTPSVTSFQVMDSVRQSVQAKFDPEMADTLFHGSTAQHFLRIFRPE